MGHKIAVIVALLWFSGLFKHDVCNEFNHRIVAMIRINCVLMIFAIFQMVENYKICLFACDILASQVIFTKRVAETLAKVGHNVIMYRIKALEYQNVKVAIDSAVKVVNVDAQVDHRVSSLYEDPHLLFMSSHDAYYNCRPFLLPVVPNSSKINNLEMN